MSYDARPWLKKVALASVKGMSDREVEERGFNIMLTAMRSAYCARHPDSLLARHPTEGRQGRPPARSDAPMGRESEDIAPAEAGAENRKQS